MIFLNYNDIINLSKLVIFVLSIDKSNKFFFTKCVHFLPNTKFNYYLFKI